MVGIWPDLVGLELDWPESGQIRLDWPESCQFSHILARSDRTRAVLAGIWSAGIWRLWLDIARFWQKFRLLHRPMPESDLSKSKDDRLEREDQLRCFKEGRLRLLFTKNEIIFRNLLSIFCQTEIIFQLTIIFALTKHRKMSKSFFKNHFTLKQTEHKFQLIDPQKHECC
jgi:hypothetical protein